MNYVISDFHGFECREFTLDGRAVKLVIPKEREPLGRWLIKTEYFGAFPSLEIEMLERGFHVAYIKNVTRWNLPSDNEAKEKLAALLEKGYAPTAC